MNTEVKLWLNKKATKEIIKEVKDLTKSNASDNKTIKILKDQLDDQLLIIRFKSFLGKQMDLADSIIKSYSHFLEEYKDISVGFETKRRPFSPLKKGTITQKDVIKAVEQYCKLLDKKKWDLLVEYFGKRINLGRKTADDRIIKTESTSKSYLTNIQKNLSNLKTNHVVKEFEIRRTDNQIKCTCKFEIKRFLLEKDMYLHSYGKFVFGLYSVSKDEFKIVEITQIVEKNEGNEGIFKKAKKMKK